MSEEVKAAIYYYPDASRMMPEFRIADISFHGKKFSVTMNHDETLKALAATNSRGMSIVLSDFPKYLEYYRGRYEPESFLFTEDFAKKILSHLSPNFHWMPLSVNLYHG